MSNEMNIYTIAFKKGDIVVTWRIGAQSLAEASEKAERRISLNPRCGYEVEYIDLICPKCGSDDAEECRQLDRDGALLGTWKCCPRCEHQWDVNF